MSIAFAVVLISLAVANLWVSVRNARPTPQVVTAPETPVVAPSACHDEGSTSAGVAVRDALPPLNDMAPSPRTTPAEWAPAVDASRHPHLVLHGGELAYQGPDEAHAKRVAAQLALRGDGDVEHFVNGVSV